VENLEMSQNFAHVREISGIGLLSAIVRGMSDKILSGKTVVFKEKMYSPVLIDKLLHHS